MAMKDLFRRQPRGEQPGDARDAVVFSGDRLEAGLVMNLLKEEGYHPREWADMPAPAYLGPVGMARVVVPAEEAERARELLASLRDHPLGEEEGEWGEEEEPFEE